MVFCLSVLDIIFLRVLQLVSCNCQIINGLKTRWQAICPRPKQGNKIEVVVLNRVCILELFCSKQGQGFKLSVAHLYPNNG